MNPVDVDVAPRLQAINQVLARIFKDGVPVTDKDCIESEFQNFAQFQCRFRWIVQFTIGEQRQCPHRFTDHEIPEQDGLFLWEIEREFTRTFSVPEMNGV